MGQQLTPEQARTIHPDSSVWVMASAGSGKTQVLTNRVLRLLLEGVAPESMLCITFTKAAAAEMSKRIFAQLAVFISLPEVELRLRLHELGVAVDDSIVAHSRTLFARTLDAIGGLQIHTIHGFCQSLLARFPLEAGISPYFTTLDEGTAQEQVRSAMLAVLGDAYVDADLQTQDDIKTLAEAAADSQALQVLNLLVSQMAKQGQAIMMTSDAITARTRSALGLPLWQDKAQWYDEALSSGKLDVALLKKVLEIWARTTGKTLTEKAATLRDWLEAGMPIGSLEAAARCFYKRDDTIYAEKTLSAAGAKKREPEIYTHACVLAVQLKHLRDQVRLFDWSLQAEAANRLAFKVISKIERAKSAKSLLGYDDLIILTTKLLQGAAAAWVLYKLDHRIEHILLDEAQDTNAAQWEILDQISAEFYAGHGTHDTTRTFFAVGDDKQAIFGFQGSDPEQFRAREIDYGARARAVRQDFASVPLTRSFRSAPAILDFVDASMGILHETHPSGFARIETHHAHRLTAPGEVVLWPLVTVPSDEDIDDALPAPWRPSAERLLARRIAEQIDAWTTGSSPICLNESGESRRIRPADILVLLRKRGNLMPLLVSEMKRLNIPVAGVDRVILTEQIAVADLLACMQFVLQPLDDLILATLMRSPLLNITQDDLFVLAYGRGDQQSLWSALQTAPESWQPARAWCLSLLAAADTMPPYEFLSLVLEQLGGRAALLARLGPEIDDPVTMLLDAALEYEASHTPSLQGFLGWIQASSQEIKRDPEAAGDRLRIMTVHGAKGLQAPLVILADTQGVKQGHDKVLNVPTDNGNLPVWCKDETVRLGPLAKADAAQRAREEAEYWRLWYVAITRAADRLYIAGWKPGKELQGTSWYDVAAATMEKLKASNTIDARWGEVLNYRRGAFGEIGPEKMSNIALPKTVLPAWATTAAPIEQSPSSPMQPSNLEAGDTENDRAAHARTRGDLVHRWLEHLPLLSPAQRIGAAHRLAREYAEEDRDSLLVQTLALIDDPAFAAIFSDHALCEVPIVARLPTGELLSGRIDRLLIADDAITLIDYKTSLQVPHEPRDVPTKIRQQICAYRAALGQLYPDRPIHCYLLWTSAPKLMLLEGLD